MDPDSITQVVIILAAAVLSAVFKAFADAFSALDSSVVEDISDEDPKKVKLLDSICSSSEVHASRARSVAAIFDAVLTVTLVWLCFEQFPGILSFIESPSTALAVNLCLTGIVLLFLQLCIVRPLSAVLSRKNPEQFALNGLSLYKAISTVLRPLTFLFDLPAKLILSIFGISLTSSLSNATEKEIRLMVDEGVIEDAQKEMINNVFEFDDRAVDEVMTHRKDIEGIDVEKATLDAVLSLAIETGYSRIPLYKEDIDSIIGIIYVKDLLGFVTSKDGFDAQKIMRAPLYVPESIHCRDLFKQFKDTKTQMAIVVDEYGGTSGIVTMEDIVESIVGNIQDEYDDEEEEISKVSDNIYRFDGSVSLDEVEKLLDIEVDEKIEYDTLGGFITYLLGRIPDDGETPEVKYRNVTFSVILVEDKRIATVDAKINPVSDEEEE